MLVFDFIPYLKYSFYLNTLSVIHWKQLPCKKALTDEALDGTAKEANGATDDGKGDGGKVRPRPLHLFCPGLELENRVEPV